MADTTGEAANIFRKSAMSRINSADDLDKYIRVTNPSAWVVLAAAILLIGGLMVWSATAIIPTTINVTGIRQGDQIVCWVNSATLDKIDDGGATASILDKRVTELEVDSMPLSKPEVVSTIHHDYLSDMLALSDWNYRVSFSIPADLTIEEDRAVPVSITVSESHPLDLVLGKK